MNGLRKGLAVTEQKHEVDWVLNALKVAFDRAQDKVTHTEKALKHAEMAFDTAKLEDKRALEEWAILEAELHARGVDTGRELK